MTKRTLTGLVVGAVCVALLVGGVAIASNMGFKYVASITANKAFNLALPWNNNYTNAESLRSDVGAASVQAIDANKVYVTWSGSGVNFTINSGEGYVVNAGASGLTPTIVGSHNPTQTLSFNNGATNIAVPYHGTHANAVALLSDLQTFNAAFQSVQRVDQDKVYVTWSGSGVNFTLALGEAIVVNANAAVSGYPYPHY